MFSRVCEGLISLARIMSEVGAEVARLLSTGSVVIFVFLEDSKEAAKLRSGAQNRLIYKIYQRIGKTLYGGDESHARNECKLRTGCRILYRDSADFARVFDDVIRPLDHEKRLSAMNLVSVSSIMTTPQATEYIKTIMSEYSQRGVYFLDLEGAEGYLEYREAQQ